MANKHSHNRAFTRILLASVLLHGSGLGLYLLSIDKPRPKTEQQTMNVQLRATPVEEEVTQVEPATKPPEREPEQQEVIPEPEQHMPTHNSEQFASNNQDRDVKGEIVAGGRVEKASETLAKTEVAPIVEPQEQSEPVEEIVQAEPEPQEIKSSAKDILTTTGITDQTISSDLEADTQSDGSELSDSSETDLARAREEFSIDALPSIEELAIPDEYLEGIGNLELLSDGELSDTLVEQPFSETEASELQLVNRYLQRMNKQVLAFWINPYKGNKMHRGIIKVELNTSGYLEQAFIYRSSGNRLLDISVLDAIRAVPRYEVPENEIITRRYYTNLSFHYSSIEEETELMPFEKDKEAVN